MRKVENGSKVDIIIRKFKKILNFKYKNRKSTFENPQFAEKTKKIGQEMRKVENGSKVDIKNPKF